MTIMALLSVQALQNNCNKVTQSHPHQSNGLKCPLPKVFQEKKTKQFTDTHREQVAIQQKYGRTTTGQRITVVERAEATIPSFQLVPWVSFGSLPLTSSLSVYRTGWPSAPAI